jgi:hypothetical protein
LDLDPELLPRPTAGPPERTGAALGAAAPEPAPWTRLSDLEWLPESGLLRRHGYLFRARRGAEGVTVEAWPWDHGQTGLAAFRQGPRAPLEVHPNSAGRFSGVLAQPPAGSDPESGWRAFDA